MSALFRSPSQIVERSVSIEDIAARVRVGLCLYDNPHAMKDGWAFLPGEEPFRIRNAIDLSNNAMWITNAAFNDFYLLGQKFHHLRRTDYLSLTLTHISRDMGVRIEGAYAQEGGAILAPYIEDTVRNAIILYTISDPMRQLQEDKLSTTIGNALPTAPPIRDSLMQALASASQAWSARNTPYADNTMTVRLWFSRQHYAAYLTSQLFPDVGWTFIDSDVGFDHSAIMDGTAAPHLMRVAIEFDSVNQEIADLIAFGSAGGRSVVRREWITDVEYRWLSQFARIRVLEYRFSKAYETLPSDHLLPSRMTDDVLLVHPVSMGILANMHWQGLAQTKYSKSTKTQQHTLIGVWLRAYDRAKCFEAAFVMQQKGYTVSGYGGGSVMVKVEHSKLGDLAELACRLGLVHPNYEGLHMEFHHVQSD